MNGTPRRALQMARKIQSDSYHADRPPPQGEPSITHMVIDPESVSGTRDYIEVIVNQINGAYEKGWYDSFFVMLRRLIETLIIDSYLNHGIASEIKQGKDFVLLEKLITRVSNQSKISISRNSRPLLKSIKTLGDLSAHNTTFYAKPRHIDEMSDQVFAAIDTMVREFINKGKFRKGK